jgi:hypothetical protein
LSGTNAQQHSICLDQPPRDVLLLGFDPLGAPLCTGGFDDVSARLLIDRGRDRIVLGVSGNGSFDFGGGLLHTQGSDVALVELGVRRPAQVTISHFAAREPRGVEVVWNIAAGEPLSTYSLSRRTDDRRRRSCTPPAGEGASSFVDRAIAGARTRQSRSRRHWRRGILRVRIRLRVSHNHRARAERAQSVQSGDDVRIFSGRTGARGIVIYDHSGAGRETSIRRAAGGKHEASGRLNAHGELVASEYFLPSRRRGRGSARQMVLLK